MRRRYYGFGTDMMRFRWLLKDVATISKFVGDKLEVKAAEQLKVEERQRALKQFDLSLHYLKQSLRKINIIEGEDYNELDFKDIKLYDVLIEGLNKKLNNNELSDDDRDKYKDCLNAVVVAKRNYLKYLNC